LRRGRKAADMMSADTGLDEVVAFITGAKEAADPKGRSAR
jgi:hypothetical protein